MPKLPWSNVSDVPSDTDVTIMGSRLPLRSYRHVPRFLWATQRIRRQLARSEGLVGYALDAELTRKTFWTVSAWVGEDVLRGFNRADPHHAETVAIKPMMSPSTSPPTRRTRTSGSTTGRRSPIQGGSSWEGSRVHHVSFTSVADTEVSS